MYRRGFLLTFPSILLALRPAAARGAELAVAHLRVDGMTWGGWPPLVKRALEGLKGVRDADVSFERAEAIVTYEKDAVSVEQMIQAVARYGFTASLKTPTSR